MELSKDHADILKMVKDIVLHDLESALMIILSSLLIRERYAATKSSVDIGPTVSFFIQRVKIWKGGR